MPLPRPDPSAPTAIHPALAAVIERNIATLTLLRHQNAARRTRQERSADRITAFSGSMGYVYLHVGWFGGWIAINLGWVGLPIFDPFPFGLLTMIVSLEAIFLATFVLISQQRLSAAADRQIDLDLQIGLLSEYEVTRILRMLDAIHVKLGITADDAELGDLEQIVYPEDVLAAIDRMQ